MTLCMEVPHLKMYNKDEWSDRKDSFRSWFTSILKTFRVEKVLSKKSSRYLWNPIVSKDVAEVDSAERESQKVRYSLSKNLLMAVFEKEKELV